MSQQSPWRPDPGLQGTPPGWYPDPSGTVRWWNGQQWTTEKRPGMSRGKKIALALIVVGVIGGIFASTRGGTETTPSASSDSDWKVQFHADEGNGWAWAQKTSSGWVCVDTGEAFGCTGGTGRYDVRPGKLGLTDVATGVDDFTDLSVRYNPMMWRCGDYEGKPICERR